MSDNEDALSESAPEGWGAMYNNLMNPVRTSSVKKKSNPSLSTKDDTQQASTGWLGGWFTAPSVPEKSSSEEVSEQNDTDKQSNSSQNDSESGSNHESSEEATDKVVSEGEGASDVDSDGFPIGPRDEVAAMLKAESDSFSMSQESMSDQEVKDFSRRYSVGDVGGMMEPGLLRRERIRNRQQYLSTAAAAELALPDSATEADQSNEQPTEAAGFWTAWFGSASNQNTAPSESKPITESPAQPAPTVPEPKAPTTAEQARSLLPSLSDPPEFEVNSFFMSPGGSFFQSSEPVMRFEGRLRRLPRQIAPYWSSKGPSATAPQYRMKSANPSSTLYMFRVS